MSEKSLQNEANHGLLALAKALPGASGSLALERMQKKIAAAATGSIPSYPGKQNGNSGWNSRMNEKQLLSYVRHGHYFVAGWLQPAAAQAAVLLSNEQRHAQVTGGVAEIGVHHGRFFIVLYLLGAPDEPAVAIDLFSHQELNIDGSGAGNLERLKKNLSKYADTSRLVVHEGDSTKVTAADLRRLGGGPLRLISIDGGHTAEITAHDLSTAEGALGDGGIIILDDCFNEIWPGVPEGVNRYFATPRSIVPFSIGAGKTFFCHRGLAQQYAAALRAMKATAFERDFLGSPVVCLNVAPLTIAGRIAKTHAWQSVKDLPAGRAMRRYYDAMWLVLRG